MQDAIISALVIVGTCLAIALAAVALFVFRPKARHRHHRRHSKRQRIDLFDPPPAPPAEPDA